MSPQECPACRARVDVSQFPAGQQVACGGCGKVLLVQPPVAPVVPPTPPRAASLTTDRRGPPRRKPPARARGHAPHRRPAPDPKLWIVAGGLLVVAIAVGAFVMVTKGEKTSGLPTASPAAGKPAAEKEKGWAWVLARFETEYETKPPGSKDDFLAAIDRLQRIGAPAHEMLRRVYADFLKGPGKDSDAARRFLGHHEFTRDIPESIAFRDYPYMRAVEFALDKRWFAPDEKAQFDAAGSAYQLVLEHEKKLQVDRKFRAVDQIRANLARDPYLRDYKYAIRWAEPYLICYSSHHRLSEFDLLSIESPDDRKQVRAEIEKRQRSFEGILDEKAVLFTDVYREFLRRYQDAFDLKPLMAAWGGRPDYEVGKRSFKDGCPLVVWIFTDRAAFEEYHSKVKRQALDRNFVGYFSPASGMVFLYDEAKDRVFEINKNVHEATHQLVHWFTRQRGGWRPPVGAQSFFEEGFAEWLGAVKMGADRRLTFVGVNATRVRTMQSHKKQFEAANRPYPIFPLAALTTLGDYGAVERYGAEHWKLPAPHTLMLFYEQSWAFVHFLHSGAEGKYRDKLVALMGANLSNQMAYYNQGKAFKRIFEIKSKRDYEDLDDEFQTFVTAHLMRIDVEKLDYDPPKLGTVGGR